MASARTHAGRVRTNNEDAYVCHSEKGVFAVIDGMGGEAAGEVAAAIAAECLGQLPASPGLASETLLTGAFQEARRRILAHAEAHPEHAKLGAVATAVRLEDDGRSLAVAHVGDTRGYLLSKKGPQRLTTDHVAPVPGRKPAVSRDLGRNEMPAVWVETRRIPVSTGDLLLLCTDGLTDVVPEDELLQELAGFQRDQTPLDSITSRLIGTALSRGGPDNVTVIALRITRFRRRKISRRMGWTLSLAVLLLLIGFVAGALLHFRHLPPELSLVDEGLELREPYVVPAGTVTQVEPEGNLRVHTRVTGEDWTVRIAGNASFDLCELRFSRALRLEVAATGVLELESCRLEAPNLSIVADPQSRVQLKRSTLVAPGQLQVEGPVQEEDLVKLPAPPSSLPPAAPPSPGTP